MIRAIVVDKLHFAIAHKPDLASLPRSHDRSSKPSWRVVAGTSGRAPAEAGRRTTASFIPPIYRVSNSCNGVLGPSVFRVRLSHLKSLGHKPGSAPGNGFSPHR